MPALWMTASLLAIGQGASASAKDVAIYAGHVFDPVAGKLLPAQTIRVADHKIVSITPGRVVQAGDEVIDLGTETVVPGMIDMHVHITQDYHGSASFRDEMERSSLDSAILGVGNARATLLGGFTSVRDLGSRLGVGIAVKKALAAGLIPGPRVWTADMPLGPTGGHTDHSVGLNPGLHGDDWDAALVDGPQEARKAVRDRARKGADVIKIMISEAGGGRPGVQRFDRDELDALIGTAHELGMKVAAHQAGDLPTIEDAVEAGVDSIEHAFFNGAPSERQKVYAAMRAHGTYLVPTIYIQAAIRAMVASKQPANSPAVQYWNNTVAVANRSFMEAYRAGVKIAYGTDTTGLIPHGSNALELPELVKVGMSPVDALRSATSNAADLLGAGDKVGRIAPGFLADIIAVPGDPLADIATMTHVDFVMKDGVVVKKGGKSLIG